MQDNTSVYNFLDLFVAAVGQIGNFGVSVPSQLQVLCKRLRLAATGFVSAFVRDRPGHVSQEGYCDPGSRGEPRTHS